MKNYKSLVAALVCASLFTPAVHADINVNFPEINDIATSPFPSPLVIWDTETYTIPAGEEVIAASISGTWGETSQYSGSTAETQLFVNGVLVSDTTTLTPDPLQNVVPFAYNFTPSELSALDSGSATLSFIETSDFEVRLSATTLTLDLGEISPTVPDAGAASTMLLMGLGGLAGVRRFLRR